MKTRRVPNQTRYKVILRDKHCLRCGTQDELTIDHISPICRGGRDDFSNLQTLCMRCNAWKNDREIDYRGQKPDTSLQWHHVDSKREHQEQQYIIYHRTKPMFDQLLTDYCKQPGKPENWLLDEWPLMIEATKRHHHLLIEQLLKTSCQH